MKKDKMKKVIMLSMLVVLVVLMTGCQSNVDASGHTLPERIISLSTPWKDMMNESFFTALFVLTDSSVNPLKRTDFLTASC